jgi:hypothetical protein
MNGITIIVPREAFVELFGPDMARQATDYLHTLTAPEPDPWLTIPEAAEHAHMTEGHMRLLVLGRPYRAASGSQPERPAVAPKIPRGDTGFAKGARVRQSAVDAYLTRHDYR